MKKKIWALGLVWLLLLGAAALADGGDWHESRIYGSVQLANYAGWCDGYQGVDGFGGITAADSFTLTVISKSASIWSEPSTGSKKLGSVSYGESLTGVSSDGGNNVAMDRNFYEVEYNGRQGWVGATRCDVVRCALLDAALRVVARALPLLRQHARHVGEVGGHKGAARELAVDEHLEAWLAAVGLESVEGCLRFVDDPVDTLHGDAQVGGRAARRRAAAQFDAHGITPGAGRLSVRAAPLEV